MAERDGIVTALGDRPTDLRRQALELARDSVSMDVTLFYRVYERDGRHFLGDVLLGGAGRRDVTLDGIVQAPAPRGTVVTPPERAPWRKGYWGLRMPLPRLRNRFSALDADVDRDALSRTAIWRRFYGPAELDDQLRALMYDGHDFVGWIGGFRQGRGERFTRRERAALQSRAQDVRALLSTAHQLEASERHEGLPCYALVSPEGRVQHATEAARHLLTSPVRQAVGRLIRGLDQDSSTAHPYTYCGGLELRVVRLDDDAGVRYLAVIDRARAARLSPLHRLTEQQRRVCEFAVVGATASEIASTLGVGVATVKYHLKQTYHALGIGSRAELAELWHRWS